MALNPIARKLREIKHSGKLGRTAYEKICVKADILYPTFMNLFDRAKVSQATIKSLILGEIISKTEAQEYERWYIDQKGKGSKHKKSSGHLEESS